MKNGLLSLRSSLSFVLDSMISLDLPMSVFWEVRYNLYKSIESIDVSAEQL